MKNSRFLSRKSSFLIFLLFGRPLRSLAKSAVPVTPFESHLSYWLSNKYSQKYNPRFTSYFCILFRFSALGWFRILAQCWAERNSGTIRAFLYLPMHSESASMTIKNHPMGGKTLQHRIPRVASQAPSHRASIKKHPNGWTILCGVAVPVTTLN